MTKTPFIMAFLLVGLAASCSSDPPAASPADAGSGDTAAVSDVSIPDAADAAASSPIGAACTPGTNTNLQGSCPDGTLCFPAPGGYCTSACGFKPCPGGSVCVLSPKDGPLCARACASDDDCRKDRGYACHPAWKACTQWLVSPKLATCTAPAPPRTSFGPVTQLSTAAGPGGYHMEPAAAIDASGNLTALYMARNDSFESSALAASTLSASGTLSAERPFRGSSKELFDTWMARDRAGKLHAVWFGHDGFDTNSKIGYASSVDGVAWTAERNLLDAADCPSAGCTDKPMIAVGRDPTDAAKDVVYVLHGTPAGVRVLTSSDAGGTFTKGALIPAIGVYGDVEVATNGSVHVVGASGSTSANRLGDVANTVEYTSSTDGGKTFTALRTVEDPAEPTPFYFVNPQVVYDATRSLVHVVYAAGTPDGKWDIRLATSADGGATFTRIKVNDDAPCANHATPTIAIEPASGKLHVAWIENRGGIGRVAYTTCTPDGATCAANEAISDRPFASYELARHTPQWIGEYFSLFVDPGGTRLHAVWTQPVAEPAGVRSRIFHAARGL